MIGKTIAIKVAEEVRTELGIKEDFGDVRSARTRYEPTNVRAYQLLREATDLEEETSARNTSEALRLIRQSIRVEGDWAESHALLSSFLFNMGEYEDALDSAVRASKLDPEHATGLRMLAYDRVRRWDLLSAEELMNKQRALYPQTGSFHYFAIMEMTNRPLEALDAAKELTDKEWGYPGWKAQYARALLYNGHKETRSAGMGGGLGSRQTLGPVVP